MGTANREKPFSHKLCSFVSSSCACPTSSASIEYIFSTNDLVWSKFRKSLDTEKAEKLKYTNCVELKKITIRIYKTLRFIILFFSSPSNFVAVRFVLFD